ncbi:MAG: alpha/beta hydrolase [Desulfobacterales bacterium]
MQTILYSLGGLIGLYLLFTLICTYFVQQLPRKPVTDPPDWGRIIDTKIPTIDGGNLEVWRIEPESPSKGLVVLAHGWSRNRDRMVSRARIFARLGFTTVLHSARDHGGSSRRRFMNAVKFAEDIEAVMKWLGQPVVLYGHSAGSAGAIIAASRNPGSVRLLFLEASYAYTREALLSLYRWVNPFFGICFGPMILFWMNLFYGNKLDTVSPARLAAGIHVPVMMIHGEKDQRFPLAFALKLKRSFAPEQAELYVAEGAGHSDSSRSPGYPAAVKSFLERHLDFNSASERL